MAAFAVDRFHEHPYVKSSPETHSHFKPTRLHYPAYSAAALPFRWTNKKFVWGDPENGVRGLVDDFPLSDVQTAIEPELNFESNWAQDHRNHRTLLECFWNHVSVEESLVFVYAKQVPLVEDAGRRILIGAGRVLKVGSLTEYDYEGLPEGKIRSLLWERMVTHSIRPGFKDGFLLPYHEALTKSDEGRNFDPAEAVAFAPEDRFNEFSYATDLQQPPTGSLICSTHPSPCPSAKSSSKSGSSTLRVAVRLSGRSRRSSLLTCSTPMGFNITTNIRWSWTACSNILISRSRTTPLASPTTGSTAGCWTTPTITAGGRRNNNGIAHMTSSRAKKVEGVKASSSSPVTNRMAASIHNQLANL